MYIFFIKTKEEEKYIKFLQFQTKEITKYISNKGNKYYLKTFLNKYKKHYEQYCNFKEKCSLTEYCLISALLNNELNDCFDIFIFYDRGFILNEHPSINNLF